MLNATVNSTAIYSDAYYSSMDRRQLLLRLIEQRFNGSLADFARVIKRSPAQVNQWVGGARNLGDAGARHIEMTLGIPGYFDGKKGLVSATIVATRGDGKPTDQVSPGRSNHSVEPGPDIRGRVPLISHVQAGDWDEALDHFAPGDAEDWLPVPISHGPRSYALRVRGDSMTDRRGGRSYPDGVIIFVDPDQVAGVVSGDRVIAKVADHDAVTFKVYREDAGRRFLSALNPDYEPIRDEFRIIGKVIGAWVPE